MKIRHEKIDLDKEEMWKKFLDQLPLLIPRSRNQIALLENLPDEDKEE